MKARPTNRPRRSRRRRAVEAVLYIRVARAHTGAETGSVRAQREACARWAAANGLRFDLTDQDDPTAPGPPPLYGSPPSGEPKR